MTRRHTNTRQMQADSFFKTRIDSDRCTPTKLVMMLVGFVFCICICAIIGSPSAAPPVFKTSGRSETMTCTSWDCSPTFHGYLNRLTKLHQVFYLEFFLEHPYEMGRKEEDQARHLNFQIVFDVQAEGEKTEGGPKTKVFEKKAVTRMINCPANREWCDKTTIFAENFLEFTGYYVQVTYKHPYISSGLVAEDGTATTGDFLSHEQMGQIAQAADHHEFLAHELRGKFEMKYVNEKFTEFEFGFKYFALVISLIVAAVYYHGLRSSLESKYWSYEQKWVLGLCVMLIGFNDPFYVIEIYSPEKWWTGLNVYLTSTFLCSLLAFWLSVFGIISGNSFWSERNEPRGICFYLPKLVLCLAIWLFTTQIFMFVRMQTEADPEEYQVDNFDHLTFAKEMLEGLLTVYFLYASALCVIAAIKASRNRGASKPQFVFLFGMTVICMLLALIGLGVGAFAPEVVYALEFTTFFGGCNVYVWFMAYAYYPAADLGEEPSIANDVEMTGVPGLSFSNGAVDDEMDTDGVRNGFGDKYGRQFDDDDKQHGGPKDDDGISIGV
jgi:hypothetical protein